MTAVKRLISAWNTVTETLGIRVLPDHHIRPRHPDVETLRLPQYCQTQTWTCGTIAALMVVHYFTPSVPQAKVFALAGADHRLGTSVRKVVGTLRGCGIRVSQRDALGFADIVDAIDRGRPILMVVNTDDPDISHWVVCYGYGRRPNRIYLAPNGLPFLSRKEYVWGMFKQHLWTEPGSGLVCAGPK